MKRGDILIITVIAFVTVTLFSTSSFLYRFNTWVDANCIFTVGKSIFYGKVPYRDLMDHKGFLLHLINGIGSLISFKTFFGIYIIELLSGSVFLLACYKTLLLFTGRKILYLMPFLALAVYSSPCFSKGASAEEFCLPFLSLSLYLGLRAIINRTGLTLRDAFLLGVFASCVFWMKYTICGLFVGIGIGISIFYIRNNRQGTLLRVIASFCMGLIPVSAAIILYFALNHAVSDLWTVYFYDNLFNYSIAPGRYGLLGNMARHELFGLLTIRHNTLMVCMLTGSLIEIFLRRDRKILFFCLTCFLCMYAMLFLGTPQAYYYPLPLSIGMPFSLLLILRIRKRIALKKASILYPAALISATVICLLLQIDKTKEMLTSDRDYVALEIGKLIMNGEEDSPTMIEYGIMDKGVYTVCGYIPECKHFCRLNLKLKEQKEKQDEYIITKHPNYIISDEPLMFDGYNRVPFDTPQSGSVQDILHDYLPFIKPSAKEPVKGPIYYVYCYSKP